MEEISSFKAVKITFKEVYAFILLEVIKDLSTLRDEIQEVVVIQKAGSVTYTMFGILGEVIALGGVIANPLGTVGVGLWMFSSALGILHENVKLNIIRKKFEYAEKSLKKYNKTSLAMKEHLSSIERDIQLLREKIRDSIDVNQSENALLRLNQIADVLRKIETYTTADERKEDNLALFKDSLDGVLSTAASVTRSSTKAFGSVTALGMILNLRSLILDVDDLLDFDNNRLCAEADKLDCVITQLQCISDDLSACFS